MRNLVTVQRIKDLLPIDGADRIEICLINGWQVIVQKGIHKVGDLVLFFEIDSFLPESDPRYASFSERFTNWGDKRGMRIKTIKLRKQLSQGVVMPLHEFPEVTNMDNIIHLGPREGDDVTDILKISKWEPIEDTPNSGTCTAKCSTGKKFPAFIKKTDQARIQNIGAMVERELDTKFEVSMKKDGSSMTVFRVDPTCQHYEDARKLVSTKLSFLDKVKRKWNDILKGKEPIYGICSRNILLKLEGDSNFHSAVFRNYLFLALDHMGGSYALQGEVVAPDIQGNYEKVNDVEFHLFDIFDISRQTYLLPSERHFYADELDIPHVTVLAYDTLRNILNYTESDDIVKKCLDYAVGAGDNPDVRREGIVFKAAHKDFSFKAVSNEYLLLTGK